MVDKLDSEMRSWEPYGLALERIRDAVAPIGRERLDIEHAQGRIAARDLVAPCQLPTAPIATRDGFAVRAADTQARAAGLPRPITVVGTAFPDTPRSRQISIASGQAVAITTGAAMPPGANAVLPIESASVKGNQLMAAAAVTKGAGVLFPGDDVRDGTPIVVTGRPLTPSQIGLLAATGLSHIEVFQAPRIGILTTGDEILSSARDEATESADRGGSPDEGRVKPPSNAIARGAWCARVGLPARQWITADDVTLLKGALKAALADCHVLLTIGGTGPGSRDCVHEALDDLGFELQFDGVRLRPGRTSGFGFLRGRPTFLLPGTPTACETAFLLLALPGILTLAGAAEPPFPAVPARLSRDLRRTKEQRLWTQAVRVRLAPGTFFLQATPLAGRMAQRRQGRLVASATADGIVIIEEGEDGLRAGDIVGVILLHATWS
jgi:molybdopterin molybdotransferase